MKAKNDKIEITMSFPSLNRFVLDKKSKITPVMQQWHYYRKLFPKQFVLFFRMGDFYEFFYNDAKRMSEVLDVKLTSRGVDDKDGKPIPLAGIPVKSLNDYLRKLIEQRIPCVIIEQTETPEKHGSKEFFGRKVSQIITPGTLLDPELIPERENNYLSAIYYDQKNEKVYGFSSVDISTGEFQISEYPSKELLISQLVKLCPVELVLSKSTVNSPLKEEIVQILPNILIIEGDEQDFDQTTGYQQLLEHYQTQSLDGFGLQDCSAGIAAAGAILSILKKRNIKLLKKPPQRDYEKEYLVIDAVARTNLELERNQRDGSIQGTLLWVFDKTQTNMGARKLRAWLRRPLRDIKKINARLDAVEFLFNNPLLCDELKSLLKQIPDIERLATKLALQGLNPRELRRLTDGLELIPSVVSQLTHVLSTTDELTHTPSLLLHIMERLSPFPELVELVKRGLKDHPPTQTHEGGIIKTGFDSELDDLIAVKTHANEWLSKYEAEQQEKINRLATRLGKKATKLKLSYTRGHGYYLEVKSTTPVPDYFRISRSLKDRTRYITDELQDMATKILSSEEQIIEREAFLFREKILKPFQEQIEGFHKNAELIASLDVILTFADLANNFQYSRPRLTENYRLRIKKGRHPVVEQLLPYGAFIPNDTNLDEHERINIITGANMGGKSTYLRQVALISILAHMGSFVPAESATIGILDRIFTRVGVVDDIWRGQSHFMVEMNETANVLNNATDRSLVILDEIGRGTSTNTGIAIATAVVEYLAKIRAKTLFATHFHQLNQLALNPRFSEIKNYHVAIEYNNKNLIFLYKLQPGGTDESFGLEIAKLAGFPESVVEKAKAIRESIDEEKPVVLNNNSNSKPESSQRKKTPKPISLKAFLLTNKYEKIVKKIRDIDINKITPLQALQLLKTLQQEIKEGNVTESE